MKNIVGLSEIPADSGIVVLKFEASWCAPCKKLTPVVLKLEEEFPDVNFLAVDVDNAKEIKTQYKILSVPTLAFLKNGQEFQRVVGLSLIEPLRKILRDSNE